MAKIFNITIMIAAIIFTFLLCSCSSIKSNSDDYADFVMPVDYEIQVFEVESTGGFELMQAEIIHSKRANLSEIWEEWQTKKEGAEKYAMVRALYDAEEKGLEEEERELKYYCESLFSNSCLNMKYLHEKNGCREVKVECDRYNHEGICIRYDISIKNDFIDKNRCI